MLAVLTTPGRSYLGYLLAQIDRQGWTGRKLLVSDGGPPDEVAPGWEILPVAKQHLDNGAAFLALLARAEVAGEDLVALEDDLDLAEGALARMASFDVPADLAFVTFFEAFFSPRAPHALYRAPCSAFLYAQALKIPARTVCWLNSCSWDLERGTDGNMACLLAGSFGLHVPAIVQHVGRRSVAHPDRVDFPQSYTFVSNATGITYKEARP